MPSRGNAIKTLRLPPVTVARVDAIMAKLDRDHRTHGLKVHRSTIVRQAIDLGLDQIEKGWKAGGS
jgi:hypothetical protein